MGLEVSPQGIMLALIVAAFAVMAYVNRDSLKGLFPAKKGNEEDEIQKNLLRKHGLLRDGNNHFPNWKEHLVESFTKIDLGPDERVEFIPMHVLDVMKTLTAINERDQLGCEDELKAIYAKIVSRKPEPAKPKA